MTQRKLRKPSKQLTGILGVNIKTLRQTKGFSQESFADKCGLHRTYIGSVERGESNVTLSTLELLASSLGVTVPDLLSDPKPTSQRSRK